MKIRLALSSDFEQIQEIYHIAKDFMVKSGNPNQWINGYPQPEIVRRDLEAQNLYVCENDGEIVGCCFFYVGEDRTYREIFGGKWLSDKPYGTIHRIAVKYHGHGIAGFMIDHFLHKCGNLRIDTHADNLPMQKTLLKAGFIRCGIIHIESGDLRTAYQREL